MTPLISVIVPVYRVELYLRPCIESILAQTLQEIEIILVDDGSPDRCGELCEEYAAKDPRIRVIHKENGGLSSARNAGLEIAQGEYIGFVDSDDRVDPDMFEFLYRNLEESGADISVCGYRIHQNGSVISCGEPFRSVQTSREAMRTVMEQPEIGIVVWNKLYRRSIFRGIRFPEGRIAEDAFLYLRLTDAADTVVFDTAPKYHYLRREGSITMRPFSPSMLDAVEASRLNHEFVRGRDPVLESLTWQHYVNSHFNILLSLFRLPSGTHRELERDTVRFLKENRKVIRASSVISENRKRLFLVLCISPLLCRAMVRLLR
ncbi:MAG: glycosyltransferase [Oscillospiraceae bacterium]|nr:glycosyltransferase [Oscillospiraceae bacterium]